MIEILNPDSINKIISKDCLLSRKIPVNCIIFCMLDIDDPRRSNRVRTEIISILIQNSLRNS
jgi:hypothetical protein